MRILRITLNGEEYPHYTITKCFESCFSFVETIWWERYNKDDLNNLVIEKVKTGSFDAVFMQLQCQGIIYPKTAEMVSKYCLVINWTGDVRLDLSAYTEVGKYVLTLFTNYKNVNDFRNLNFKSEYLQVGYDHIYYYNKNLNRSDNIVFCGNYYPHVNFPLTNERYEMVKRLKYEFGNNFKLYGLGWEKIGINADGFLRNEEESYLYNTSLIAINYSHFNYSRYFSDRLLRELSCGCFVLSHKFEDYQVDFGENNFITFNDLDDLVSKCKKYLINKSEAIEYGKRASEFVSKNYKWINFTNNLKTIINKYK